MSHALAQAGERTGINFNSDRLVHNTMKSHRLVRLGGEQGKQDDIIEAIFHAYFEECANIADPTVLVDIAKKAGVDCTKEYLEGSEGKAEVLSDYEQCASVHGVSGVPFYVLSREGNRGKIKLSGAQPSDAFVEAFEALS
ncbi:unnamed protein product [Choristocarpus tenellus]